MSLVMASSTPASRRHSGIVSGGDNAEIINIDAEDEVRPFHSDPNLDPENLPGNNNNGSRLPSDAGLSPSRAGGGGLAAGGGSAVASGSNIASARASVSSGIDGVYSENDFDVPNMFCALIKPLTQCWCCCCCTHLSLQNGMNIIVTFDCFQLVFSIYSFFFMLSLIISNSLLLLLSFYFEVEGLRGANKMSVPKFRMFYYYCIVRLFAFTVSYFVVVGYTSPAASFYILTILHLGINLYFLFVVYSFFVRLQAGQYDLLERGPFFQNVNYIPAYQMQGIQALSFAMNNPQDRQNPHAEEWVHNFERCKVTAERLKNEPECVICQDDYSEGEDLPKLPCNHAFHDKCVIQW
eukprot:CAMPEP_0115043686 /NCGR_PEP_ID=MMETSP0216-20121206/47014_1 /TAXON_ID=223996 /ORGANISM="Protocruzia adherens, Strain Boccale" /LENGTH=350 /DNA_ID=CAMNT_0002426049 /DNA_START=47 /DNA_END=1096 /DNA_ORIENTATION=-